MIRVNDGGGIVLRRHKAKHIAESVARRETPKIKKAPEIQTLLNRIARI